MKARPPGFIADSEIDHEGEIFDYICELHDYLWRVARAMTPSASGCLGDFLDEVVEELELHMATTRERGAKSNRIRYTLWRIATAAIGTFVAVAVMYALGLIRFVPMSPTTYLLVVGLIAIMLILLIGTQMRSSGGSP